MGVIDGNKIFLLLKSTDKKLSKLGSKLKIGHSYEAVVISKAGLNSPPRGPTKDSSNESQKSPSRSKN